MNEYCVRLVSLPIGVNGVTVLSPDGFANIYINDRLSYDEQQKAAAHELIHVQRDDFFNDLSTEQVEEYAEKASRRTC